MRSSQRPEEWAKTRARTNIGRERIQVTNAVFDGLRNRTGCNGRHHNGGLQPLSSECQPKPSVKKKEGKSSRPFCRWHSYPRRYPPCRGGIGSAGLYFSFCSGQRPQMALSSSFISGNQPSRRDSLNSSRSRRSLSTRTRLSRVSFLISWATPITAAVTASPER